MNRGSDYEETRQEVLERDNHRCQFCSSEEEIDVHHIKPRSEFESVEVADRVLNLVSLCPSCHHTLEYYEPIKQERKLWEAGWRPVEFGEEIDRRGLLGSSRGEDTSLVEGVPDTRFLLRHVMDLIEEDLDQLRDDGYDEMVDEFYKRFNRVQRLEREMQHLRGELDEARDELDEEREN